MHPTKFLIALIFLAPAIPVSAAVVINEVQISPIDGRFIELHNSGDADVDLTGWYIQRKTATGSSFGSLVTSTKFENKTIKAGGYFLISRSSLANADIILDTLTLTESNALRMRNGNGEDVGVIEWGSIPEGQSYQRTSAGGWMTASPTPGAANVSSDTTANSTNTGNTNFEQQNAAATTTDTGAGDAASQGSIGSSFPVDPQIFASIGEKKKPVVVGADFTLSGKVWGLKKEPIDNARMLWSFGDGTSGEGKTVSHAYRYPGTYIVILDTSSGFYTASDRVVVEAVPADVIISSAGDAQSSFIELYNKSKYELDLSSWSLSVDKSTFVIPNHTFLAASAKLKFASDITKLTPLQGAIVILHYPNGAWAASYAYQTSPIVPVSTGTTNVAQNTSRKNSEATQNPSVKAETAESPIQTFETDTQAAFAIGAPHGAIPLWWWLSGVLLLAGAGVGSVFAIKRNLVLEPAKSEADDYEIIEETEDDKIPF